MDDQIHIDLASDIIKALFNDDLESAFVYVMCRNLVRVMLIASVEEDKKTLCQLLGKLYLPDQVDDDKLRSLKLLIHNLSSVRTSPSLTPLPLHSIIYSQLIFTQRRPLRDTSTRNAFSKFEASINKKYEAQLADFNEDDYRQLEYLKGLFEFLDQIVPEDEDDDAIELPKKKGGRKR